MTSPNWRALATRYPESWLRWLERTSNESHAINVTAASLAGRDLEPSERERHRDLSEAATNLLGELAASGWLTATTTIVCPICGFELSAGDVGEICPNPDEPSHAFTDQGATGPVSSTTYERSGIARRHIGWLFAAHGMNTRGSWQESFNWLVSTSFGRMVPVAIYKYGVVRPGVLARRRHRTLMSEIAERIHHAGGEAGRIVEDARPDVIAHSFGTLLLGKALHRYPDLRVGRIITLGCILRPDFDWATLVGRGQVEAVLNNYGTADTWAKRAHATIPDAGPAGRRGFDYYPEQWPEELRQPEDRVVFNVAAAGFSHSQFFDDAGASPTTLERQFTDVWEPFLTTRNIADIASQLASRGNEFVWPNELWRPKRWPFRAVTGGWGRTKATYSNRQRRSSD